MIGALPRVCAMIGDKMKTHTYTRISAMKSKKTTSNRMKQKRHSTMAAAR